MRRIGLKTVIAVFLCLVFSVSAFAGDIQNSRLIPEKKVIIYEDGKKIGEFTKEAPCPEDVFLSCQGKCGIKLNGLTLVAEDNSMFAIKNTSDSQYLKVKKGTLFFGLSEMQRPFVFVTSKGAISANRMLLNASTDKEMVKGYVKVSEQSTEVGVIEGGSLQMLTQKEDKLLQPGNKIILAQADMGSGSGGSGSSSGLTGALTTGEIAGFTIAGGAAIGVAGLIGTALFDDDDDDDASPSSP